ncbi:unnamed protein product [Lota lota]
MARSVNVAWRVGMGVWAGTALGVLLMLEQQCLEDSDSSEEYVDLHGSQSSSTSSLFFVSQRNEKESH